MGYAASVDFLTAPIEQVLYAVGMAVGLTALFRGHGFAWWTLLVAFGVLGVMTGWEWGRLTATHGLRVHPKLMRALLEAVLCLATVGLLLSLRLRKALPPPAIPFWDTAPVLGRVFSILMPIFILTAGVLSFFVVFLFATHRPRGETSIRGSLRTITSAQADFRANDRDGNGVNDFWTGDVQGLYAIVPKGGAQPIQLIERSVALADGNPLKGVYAPLTDPAQPLGAWFNVLIDDRSENPAERYGMRNTSKFGYIAYPGDFLDHVRVAQIVNQDATFYQQFLKKEIAGSRERPPGPLPDPQYSGWPSDAALRAGWQKSY